MDNPLILQLLQKLNHLSCAHKTIHLCYIPSHIGIRGNEAADMAAKGRHKRESKNKNQETKRFSTFTVSRLRHSETKKNIA